jgi:Zn-dependent M28 family amino/carboxypeptidase
MKQAWAAVLAIAVVAAMPALGAPRPDGERWWSHVRALADDKLEGRDTGSPGHRKAAEYVASEFQRLGLKPAGTEGYLQPVKFLSKTIDETHTRLELVRSSGNEPLELGPDAIVSLQVDPAQAVDAALVFAGYGLTIPDFGHDDFRDFDVRGKVVVYFSGAPADLPGPLASHAQSLGERADALRRAGAVGMVRITNPKSMDIPWERLSLARSMPSMSLADPSMDEGRGLSLALNINPARAEKLFAGSGHTLQELIDADQAKKPLPHFALPARIKASVGVTRRDVTSQNVVAVLPGSDPKLKGEYVVFSAHLDHIGVGQPINGDSIYNGAMDNASGVAGLLDVAEILKETGARPKRSLLFLAVTGEEKGLQGSRYFASAPTVDAKAIVADINTDMFLPLYPLKRLIVFGLDESDLKNDVTAVAKPAGLAVLPDPEPKRNIFIRSDQYSFVRQGIPSLMLMVGYEKGTPEEATLMTWLKDRYHAPSDDLNQPVDKAAAGAFDFFVARLLTHVADRDDRPRWSDSSFFKRFVH